MSHSPPPQLGFNNNVKHRGRMYHIQTEDSGVKYPHVITHLFADGGRILKSLKTSYAEHVGTDQMAREVRELMRVQHKSMFDALRAGALDDLLDDTAPNAKSPDVPQPSAPDKTTLQANVLSPAAPTRSHTSSTSHAAASITPVPASSAKPTRRPLSDAPESAYDSIASPILSVGQAPPAPTVPRATSSTSHPAASIAAPRQSSTFEAVHPSSADVSDNTSANVHGETFGSWSQTTEEHEPSRPYLRGEHRASATRPVAASTTNSTTNRYAVDQFNPSVANSKSSPSSHNRQPRVPRPQPASNGSNRVPRPAVRPASFLGSTSSFQRKDSSFGPSDVNNQSLDEVIRGFLDDELGGDDVASTRDETRASDAGSANGSNTNRGRTEH